MSELDFVHLHNHSHYSLGDAICKIPDLFALAQENQMSAIALTDHGNMFGSAEFFLEATKYPDIKPIIGCEIYLTAYDLTSRTLKPSVPNYHHLLLLAKNEQGYKNLSKMISLSYTQGFYYRPRIDFKTLEQYSEGLIASSACLGGEIPSLLLRGNFQEAQNKARYFEDLFGKNNFFLEIMNHGIPEENTAAQEILKLSKETNIPLIATNDIHYPKAEDWNSHDIFLCISSGKKQKEDKRLQYPAREFYFKSKKMMYDLIAPLSTEALTNTVFIAQQCSYKPALGSFQIPSFTTPQQETESVYLRNLCEKSMPEKYPKDTSEAQERLNYELKVIEKMGFESYFLIVQDFINYAKNNNIAVGPGRGSAAGSIVAYLLGITQINPLKYNLLFERFLNPGRISMPDIDTDFDDEKRDQVIEYVTQKYGEDKVAQIITFGRMKAKLVIRDVARALDIPLQEADTLAKLIPNFTSLNKAFEEVNEFRLMVEQSSSLKNLFQNSLRLENLVRHTSVHAAGIIIGKTPLPETVPLYKDNKTGIITTQIEGKYLEEFGLLKMDFLGLRNLRIIQDTIKQLQAKSISIVLDEISLEDAETYKTFQQGKGSGIFQCESSGMQELMKKLHPTCFEDIIALIALYRPGPLNSGMTSSFIKNKNSKEFERLFQDPNIQKIVDETYGVMVYQEQIMQLSQKVAGFSLADADNLRKAMGKKDAQAMAKMAKMFIDGANKNGFKLEFSQTLFDNMAKFAEYGFNKSHSAAYALIAFQTAYLKTHFPLEYMCALLNAECFNADKLQAYLQSCKEMKITILPPDINKSFMNFCVEDNAIRFGFIAIKNVGQAVIQDLIKERTENGDFTTITNLAERTIIFKKTLEGLCLSGSLDKMIPNRASFFEVIETIMQFQASLKKDKASGMDDLFGEESKAAYQLNIPLLPEMDLDKILEKEKEILGCYISGHPLDQYQDLIKEKSSHTTQEIKNIKDEDSDSKTPLKVVIAGRLVNPKLKITKKNDEMALYDLQDLYSEIPVIAFPRVYKEYKDILAQNLPLIIEGKVDLQRNDLQISINKVTPLNSSAPNPSPGNNNDDTSAPNFVATNKKEVQFSSTDKPQKISQASTTSTSILIELKSDTARSGLEKIQAILKENSGSVRVSLKINNNIFELSSLFFINSLSMEKTKQSLEMLPFVQEVKEF